MIIKHINEKEAMAAILEKEQLNNKLWIDEVNGNISAIMESAGYDVRSSNILTNITLPELTKLIEANGKWDGDIILADKSGRGYADALKNSLELINDGSRVYVFKLALLPSELMYDVADPKIHYHIRGNKIHYFGKCYEWIVFEKGFSGRSRLKEIELEANEIAS